MKTKNSLDQYLDFYSQHQARLKQDSAPWLASLRALCFDRLRDMRLPDHHTENYEKTSLEEMFAPDFGINIGGLDLIGKTPANACGAVLPKSVRIILHNEVPVRVELPAGYHNLPQGLHITSLSKLSDNANQFVAQELEELAVRTDNAALLLNIMLGTDGVVITTDAGAKIELPIQIINFVGASIPMLTNKKLLIYTAPGSELNILHCEHSVPAATEHSTLANSLVLARMEEESTLRFASMEETASSNRNFTALVVKQQRDTQLHMGSITLMNGTTRNDVKVDMLGNGAQAHINGLVIGEDASAIDNSTHINLHGDHCVCNQIYKYALYGQSAGAFEGTITVHPDARFNEAHQTNRNVIASEGASMYSKPQLLIYNDDVKCSHGATTGQLDSNALYYMQTRGIPLDEAKSMLMQAFMNDVVEQIDFPGLRERLHILVERRLRGEDVTCDGCKLYIEQ